jgi:hypothetical protein
MAAGLGCPGPGELFLGGVKEFPGFLIELLTIVRGGHF